MEWCYYNDYNQFNIYFISSLLYNICFNDIYIIKFAFIIYLLIYLIIIIYYKNKHSIDLYYI